MNVSWDDDDGEHDDTAEWRAVSDLIESLDGDERTHVSLGDGEAHLVCGGSAKQGLVLFVGLEGEIHQLLSATHRDEEEKVELVAAGQPGEYPVKFVVDVASARKAARTFMEDGAVDPSLEWERQ